MARKNIFKSLILNSGYPEPVYEQYRSEIVNLNNRLVKATSFIGSVMMALLTIASIFVPSVSKVFPLYFGTAIAFSLICLCVTFLGNNNSKVTLIGSYAFLTAAFFFAIGLDVIQKNTTATTICVLLVALPLLIVDKPYRETIFFVTMAVVFMFEAVYIKKSPKASIDVLNAISFFVVGSFLGYRNNRMLIRNFIGQSMLEIQRDTDTLTTLYNKGAIESKAKAFLDHDDVTAAMMVIDMDNFKMVNDTYGHHSGDEILTKIAKMLLSLFRSSDLISRFGGDEFIIFLPTACDKEVLKAKAESILKGVEQIRIKADPDYRAHICIGIGIYPEDGDSYEKLFRNVDSAMYYIKKNGKDGYGFYNSSMKKKILIVDDIEVNRVIFRETLKAEFLISEAADGKTAIEHLEAEPDTAMVITDIQMPEMDGIELIKRIRSKPEFDHVAIIASTQYGDLVREEEVINLSADDFIYKPVSSKVIPVRVKNVLKIREEG